MVGNHFDSVGHSFCDDLKSSSVKTSLVGKVSMQACVFLRSVGGKVWPVVLQSHSIRMKCKKKNCMIQVEFFKNDERI